MHNGPSKPYALSENIPRQRIVPIFIVSTIRTQAHREDVRALAAMEHLAQMIPTLRLSLSPLPASVVSTWLKDSLELPTQQVSTLALSTQGNPLSMKAVLFTSLTEAAPQPSNTHTNLQSLMTKRYVIWSERSKQALRS